MVCVRVRQQPRVRHSGYSVLPPMLDNHARMYSLAHALARLVLANDLGFEILCLSHACLVELASEISTLQRQLIRPEDRHALYHKRTMPSVILAPPCRLTTRHKCILRAMLAYMSVCLSVHLSVCFTVPLHSIHRAVAVPLLSCEVPCLDLSLFLRDGQDASQPPNHILAVHR
jgi:hypothetical protein